LKKYNKLVRDKIPETIEKDGRKAVYHILSEDEFVAELDKKLNEEVKEYQKDKSLDEMADIMEVLYAIIKARGYSIEELEEKRREKSEERGGFDKKVYLEYVDKLSSEIMASVSDIKALKKWSMIPDYEKELLLNNVYCHGCGTTTIVDYCIINDRFGIVLQGKCEKCGASVTRCIENGD
jgi:predicted house-cleaning noncanonical NTP pyrophosphatase (MazG superfamily)